MKVLSFENYENLPIQFDRESVMVMAYARKALVFEKSTDLDFFSDVFYLVENYLEENNEELYDELCEELTWFTDQCEEESFMVDHKENESYIYQGRQLKITKDEKFNIDNYGYESVTKFGTLNGKDTYSTIENVKHFLKIFEIYRDTHNLNKDSSLDEFVMITEIISLFKEEIEIYEKNPKDFFMVNFYAKEETYEYEN